jgi:hypothetical protein
MLKYKNANNKECENKDPAKFDLEKCNDSLYNTILGNIKPAPVQIVNLKNIRNVKNTIAPVPQQTANNADFLYEKRCIFMTFKEYNKDKVHINNNMCCNVFPSINEVNIKKTIKDKLEEIKNTKLRPATLTKIPLPIYVMLAKRLENVDNENVFMGNYEVVLYIPNLYNYKNDNTLYTFFPSLDAFSKQNKWMELMTSKSSKYLDIIEISKVGDNKDTIKKKNYFKKDLDNTCLNMGCVAAEQDRARIPVYSNPKDIYDAVQSKSPYIPSACLQTPYYNSQMMNLSETEEKRFRGTSNVLIDNFDIVGYCSDEKIKIYEEEKKKIDKETFDVYLCTNIKKCEQYDKQVIANVNKQDIKYDNNDEEKLCKDTTNKERISDLMNLFLKNNIKPGTNEGEYSKDYNDNILEEMAFRKSKYPGFGDDIQEIVFRMFAINEKVFSENWFCHMPWGEGLLKQDYVINEQETFEIDRVSFKSFNDVFEMKFYGDGYLYIYENNKRKFQVPNQSKNLSCFKKRILRFENMLLNIYGYDEHNNYDLRGSVSLTNKDMYVSPASLILSSDNGELLLYDLGLNNKTE